MSIEKLRKDINKRYGTEIVSKGLAIQDILRIPTGSLSLDLETGGGIPVGRITTVTGQYSDGKTSVVLKIVAEYQKKYPNKDVVYIDVEGAIDKNWAVILGVDFDNLFVVHPEYSQQAFDIAEQCITADVGLLVVDSIAALVPKEEAEATMEDWQVGLAARINNKFIRRTHSSLNDKRANDVPPTVILINQLRESIGGYGSNETEPGGKGIGFAASLRIKLRKGDLYPKPKGNYDQSVVPKAQQIRFYVEKNKTAPPHTRGHFWFYFDTLDQDRPKGSIDKLEEIIRYAKKYNVVIQRGSMFDLPDPVTGEIQSFKGATALAEYIRETEEVAVWIEQELARKIRESYVEEEPELLEQEGNNEAEGKQSSEGTERETSTSVGSDSVGQGGLGDLRVPNTAQVDSKKVTFSEAIGLGRT